MTAVFDANTRTLHADWLDFPVVKATFAALNRDGFEARIVGGAVRNALLGEPIQDIDFAVLNRRGSERSLCSSDG